ncbi:hypothetical protein OsI_30232 [Oryza sativa Indica Group]|uniref:Protein-L-isoaspartate O-methyltransferase n=3 Tax=Oryza sativa TaxID=4530 RepID=A3BVP3_ORYSJ|nr:hypothetical protein OsI_30232 [Oryza sativa Indica Group]EAZ43632.1 hypothetical protein OsJ_28255 [Oryza sativa Japonica Group]
MEHRLWSSGASDKNKAMVEQLQRYGIIKSSKVAQVMETIDRGLFVPPGASPYFDSPMPIGYNATISAPHMHASCLELLEKHLQPGMRALDVGSGFEMQKCLPTYVEKTIFSFISQLFREGTGYLTACFAIMVGPEGRAVGVEHIPELVTSSIENIKKSAAAPQLTDGSLSIHITDGREGWPELAPYDAIHVGAAAPQIPQALIEQLKPGGRMVIPVGTMFQELKVVDKNQDGKVSIRDETAVRYVPLTSKDAQLQAN